ncbi:MAG: hypothetical protein JWR84_1290 [Caulobacter sp.]|nr:hypothetical protein [Caulobacter sp.]
MTAPRLADQLEFIASAPDPKAESYYFEHRINRITSNAPADHSVLGVVVTLEAGARLHTALHKDRARNKADRAAPVMDIGSVSIICDTLEVLSPTCIPEADVTIHCRRLLFGPKGEIDTSPLDWLLPRARDASVTGGDGETGSNGRHAGKLSIFCDGVAMTDGKAISGTRLKANGGRGQDAGHGKNGVDGTSRASTSGENWAAHATGFGTTQFKAKFDPPAYYFDATVNMLEIIPAKHKIWGVDAAPTSGTDGRAPGVPGDGGNGGLLTSNKADLVNSFETSAGPDGVQAPDVQGGLAGTPTKSARYTLTCRYNLFNEDNGRIDYGDKKTSDTKAGASHKAKASVGGPGKRTAPALVGSPQAWLHPRLLRHMLMVIRDLYLGNARDRVGLLLAAYADAMVAGPPSEGASGWTSDNAPEWHASLAEISALRQRLERQEDYFGNPAGYAPLLSLQSALRAYDLEADTALKTLLLSRWVAAKALTQANAATACDAAVTVLNENSAKIAAQMAKTQTLLTTLEAQADEVLVDIDRATTNLLALHAKLLLEVSNDAAKKATLKFTVNMAAAILQVVPVGQPVLGTIGKLASVAADFDKAEPMASVKQAGETVKDAVKKSKEAKKEAEKAMKEAVKQGKEDGKTEEEIEAIKKKKPSAWSKAASRLGPAGELAGKAFKSLQVPQSELGAEVAKLKAKSKEWEKIAEEIRVLGEKKARLFSEMSRAIQQISEGYARASNNASAVVSLSGQRSKALSLLDPAALQYIADLGQRAEIALTTSLYYLVRAYETTAFRPADVNWAIVQVFKKIDELITAGKDRDAQAVLAEAKLLSPIFEQNLKTLHGALLKDGLLQTEVMPLELTIGRNQPEALAELNGLGRTRIDPVRRGLVQPRQQRALLSKIVLDTLEFEGAAPESGNCLLTLTVGDEGVVRIDEHLFGVRRDKPMVWSWGYGFSGRKISPSLPSPSALDLLNMILQTTDQGVRQKLSLPPVWTNLDLEVAFSDLPSGAEPPKISKLVLSFQVEWSPAKQGQVVLDVRSNRPDAEIVLNRADLGTRKDGQGGFQRVFGRGSSVELKSTRGRDWAFASWEVDGKPKGSGPLTLDLKQDTVVTAICVDAVPVR